VLRLWLVLDVRREIAELLHGQVQLGPLWKLRVQGRKQGVDSRKRWGQLLLLLRLKSGKRWGQLLLLRLKSGKRWGHLLPYFKLLSHIVFPGRAVDHSGGV
jgi:hypothetical protein